MNKSQLLEWALEYDAYQRLAQGPDRLAAVVKPLRDWIKHHGDAPAWAGVDLLRGLAFCLHRELNWTSDAKLREDEIISDLKILAEAVDRHPSSVPNDRFIPHLIIKWKKILSSWIAMVQLTESFNEDLILHSDEFLSPVIDSSIACYRIFEAPSGYQAWVWVGSPVDGLSEELAHMPINYFCQLATRMGSYKNLSGAKNAARYDATERIYMGKSV